jgi:DNA-directed RNA polymerase subunit L/DNA-directed RNA polymerase alpha subunit
MSVRLSEYQLNEANQEASFIIEDMHFAYINSLRRSILQDIQVYGFPMKNINMVSNNSMLNNQYLAHRISQIPLFNPNNHPLQDYVFRIERENNTNVVSAITTDDFNIRHKTNGNEIPTLEIFPHDPITDEPILIVKLNPRRYEERVVIEAIPELGSGKDNASFQCTSQASYGFVVDEQRAESEFEKQITEDMDEEAIAKARRLFNSLEKKRYYHVDDNGNPSKVRFMLESIGPVPVQNIPVLAADALIERFTKLEIELSKADSDLLIFQKSKKHQNAVIVKFVNEDDTMANPIRHYIYKKYIEEDNKENVSYVGYKRPHYLKNNVIVKMITRDGEIDSAKAVLSNTLANLKGIFSDFKNKYTALF